MRVLALISAILVPLAVVPFIPASSPVLREVVPNDNRRAAGTLRGDTLTARFTVQMAQWTPDASHDQQVDVQAMTEDGKAPQIPAPLLRVRSGTVMRISVRNALPDSTLRLFGLWSHPNEGKDTVRIAPGEMRELVFTAGVPGTYMYGARIGLDKPTVPERETAIGAFIVDSLGPVPPDRVFVLNIWSDSVGNALAINGLSWPATERIEATTGDTLRWRVINGTIRPHPMHLHGFYFTLLSKGDARADTAYAPGMRYDEVTDRMRNMSTLTMQWTPDRPGNWLFHCHIAFHVVPEAAQLARPDSMLDETHSPDANEHMRGLILGIRVKKRRSDRAESRVGTQALRLEVRERTPRPDKRRRMEYVLGSAPGDASSDAPRDTAYRAGGPLLILQQGRPTDITVTNHLREPTSVHWHGIELESYSDGVAGWSGMGARIMQMIAPADSFTARLSLPRAGTFIYHTHLGDLEQLSHGLYGPIVVMPAGQAFDPRTDHVYIASVDGEEDEPFVRVNGDSVPRAPLEMRVGEPHRLRLINILPGSDMRWIMERDSAVVTWQPLAKDGADLGPGRRVMTTANVRLSPGETRDMLFTPTTAGEYVLRVTPAAIVPGWRQRVVVRP